MKFQGTPDLDARIGALQVWQKQDGGWKLLARQGFRLPAPA
jgi:hypothetical protein